MKKLSCFTATVILLMFGCNKTEEIEPVLPKKAKTISVAFGDNQDGFYNIRLADSIIVLVQDSNGHPLENEAVSFEFQGNQRTPQYFQTDQSGKAYGTWIPECEEGIQEATFYLLSSFTIDAKKTDSVEVNADISVPTGWARSCGLEISSSVDRFFRKNNGIIYLVSEGEIYLTPDDGKSWELFEHLPPLSSPFPDITDLKFNSNGGMYIATSMDGLFYSSDQINWSPINNGIENVSENLGIYVEDSVLFASFYFEGLYRSINNGQSWEKILIDGRSSDRYYFLNRHPNGDLYLFDKWTNLWKSVDSGDNWIQIPIAPKYTRSEVQSFAIDDTGVLYIGSREGTLAVVSSISYTGVVHDFHIPNNSTQPVKDIQFENGITYFTVQSSPESGIYSSENWERLPLQFEQNIENYIRKIDGSFLINSFDGTYNFW